MANTPARQAAAPGQVNPARMYDYFLGGQTNYEQDRAAGERLIAAKPDLVPNIRASRKFLERAVTYLAAEAGVAQFLDIGTGIPAMNNTHEVAQRARPDAKIVYVDNDPMVLVHARALLRSAPAGTVAYVEADLRDPALILAQAGAVLDFGAPVAITLLGILYMIRDSERPYDIVARLMAATAAGSYLAISHPASDVHADGAAAGAEQFARATGIAQTNRGRAEVAAFFDGLDLVDPGDGRHGIVTASQWRPRQEDHPGRQLSVWAGVGRKSA
jgi:hypothetical protein